jgi:hypothetical protein
VKTYWKAQNASGWRFYCPLCQRLRQVPFRPSPGGFQHVSQVVLTALFLTVVGWPLWGWKGIVSVVPLWALFEATYRYWVRGLLRCPDCGFDPYLFLRDPKLAAQQIDAFWKKRFSDQGIPYPEPPQGGGKSRERALRRFSH